MDQPVIILAAGGSRRLGSPKQMVLYAGETLLNRAIRLAREAGANPLLVVLGASYERIRGSIRAGDIRVVRNERWEEGIASSIRAGLEGLLAENATAQSAMIMTCDQPRLTAVHLRRLLEEFRHAEEQAVVASGYAGTLGVPAVFPRAMFAHLERLGGDEGARKVIASGGCPVIEVALPEGEDDIDTPEDLRAQGLDQV